MGGSSYDGEWSDDEKCGQGIETYADGSSYVGQFWQGRKHGIGCYRSASEAIIFEGEMQHGKMHGLGKFYFMDGRAYMGQWANGHMNGEGVLTWADGRKYSGGMKHDQMHGEGTIRVGNVAFAGRWFNGEQVVQGAPWTKGGTA